MNSTDVLERLHIGLTCIMDSSFTTSPCSFRSSVIARLASSVVIPAYLPAASVILPSVSIPFTASRLSSLKNWTSTWSP